MHWLANVKFIAGVVTAILLLLPAGGAERTTCEWTEVGSCIEPGEMW
jgi:hypothetical protein